MTDRGRLQLTLELDSRTEPITGRMRAQRGPTRPFTGWLGLAAALGSVLEHDQRDAEAAPRSDREMTGEAGSAP
jgi:hypothetical protein